MRDKKIRVSLSRRPRNAFSRKREEPERWLEKKKRQQQKFERRMRNG